MDEIGINGFRAWRVGTGDPLLVVHGGPGLDHSYLQEWLLPFGSRRMIVFYDQLGCGANTTPVSEVSTQATVKQLESLVRGAAAFGSIGILAHSWGAYLVYEVLRRLERVPVGKLVLVSPVGLTRSRFDASGERLISRIPPKILADVEQVGSGPASGVTVMRILAPFYQARTTNASAVAFTYYNQGVYDRILATLGTYDCRDIAAALPSQTLLLYGDADIEVPDETREIHHRATVKVLPESGHFLFAEQPALFTTEVHSFLSDRSGPG